MGGWTDGLVDRWGGRVDLSIERLIVIIMTFMGQTMSGLFHSLEKYVGPLS
jgi:hypothetical protein